MCTVQLQEAQRGSQEQRGTCNSARQLLVSVQCLLATVIQDPLTGTFWCSHALLP